MVNRTNVELLKMLVERPRPDEPSLLRLAIDS
jgi:hypothetical protein